MRFSLRRPADSPSSRRAAREAAGHRAAASARGEGAAEPPAAGDAATGVPAAGAAGGTPTAGPDASPEKQLADVPELVAELERHGHDARLTDRTDPRAVPAATSRTAYLVFRDSVDLLVRRAPSPQRLDLRVRCDDGQLLVSMQSVGVDPSLPPLQLTAQDLGPLNARIEAAGGRTTVRATQNGNWIAIGRLPL